MCSQKYARYVPKIGICGFIPVHKIIMLTSTNVAGLGFVEDLSGPRFIRYYTPYKRMNGILPIQTVLSFIMCGIENLQYSPVALKLLFEYHYCYSNDSLLYLSIYTV